MTDAASGVYARIGSLASRLADRVGRAFGNCRRCGRPTRSHATASGVECHRCHAEHGGGLVADGGGAGESDDPTVATGDESPSDECRACGRRRDDLDDGETLHRYVEPVLGAARWECTPCHRPDPASICDGGRVPDGSRDTGEHAGLDCEAWATLLDEAGEPATWGEVRRAVAEAGLLDVEDPGAAVDDALDRGLLVEQDDGAAFPTLALADQDGEQNPDAGGRSASGEDTDETARERGLAAFEAAVDYFTDHLDDAIHPDEDTTAREHLREHRGWSDETIREKCLGFAPANGTGLLDHLMREGFGREAILATGLFWDDLSPIWTGRIVLPYLDDDRPVFAISRSVGHPADDAGVYAEDDDPAKYHKIPRPDERAVYEPIYGVATVEPGEPVVVTEGIADAVTAHQAGYPCVSPVTTTFKKGDRERLVDALRDADVPRVYVVQDAERPGSDLGDDDTLALAQYGEGVRGAVSTAAFLDDAGIEAYLGELPRPGLGKVDLDDYLLSWGDLDPVLASAKPARQHPAYDPASDDQDRDDRPAPTPSSGSDRRSALFDLDLVDVVRLDAGERGTNPLGHHGDSENYYVVARDGETAYDHKYKATYTAATHLLVDAGERSADDPEGELSDREVFAAWKAAKDAGALGRDDAVPYRALRGVAVADGLVDEDQLVRRDSDSGRVVDGDDAAADTYLALPAGAYDEALAHVEDTYGVEPGREPVGGADDRHRDAPDQRDPREVEVVLDPGRAWRAAGLVEPVDLPDDHGLPTDDAGTRFTCPRCGEAVDVVRAAALDRGLFDGCGDALDESYARGYTAAREEYDAPLPRFVSTADAVYQYDTVLGAVRELDFFHLDHDALRCDVTGEGDDVGGEAVLTLDPTPVDGWRDSESGESVLVFPSGTVYDVDAGTDQDRGRALDALRFVALDSGVIDQPDDPLGGADFCEAYRLAREVYGAPLPRWFAAEADDAVRANVPLLPTPEQLLADGDALDPDLDDLDDVYREVGDLVADATDPERAGRPTVVSSLPATGKTTAAIRNARDQPTTYLAPRLELQAQAVEKAESADVSVDLLPVFSDGAVAEGAVAAAVEHVREHGKDALRDRWRLVEAVGGTVFAEGDQDDQDDPEVDLDRATCATAAGDHGEAWALAVHAARALGFTPREIHRDARGLFGVDALPCCSGDEDDQEAEDTDTPGCPYSAAWERIADREDPADLLVGSYGHAYVEGARTYRTGTRRDPEDRPRAVVLDEWPGDQFATDYGTEAFGFAAWLARSLRPDVEALADVDTDLAGDEFVRTYLDGEVADAFPGVRDAVTGIVGLRDAREAVDAAATIREDVDADRLDDLGVGDLLDQLVDGWRDADGVLDGGTRSTIARDLLAALDGVRSDDRNAGVAAWVREAVVDVLLDASGPDVRDALAATPAPGDGPLAAVVDHALDAAADLSYSRRAARAALDAAEAALRGGDDGVRELAVWSDDGHAHPDAGYILRAVITPTDDDLADRVRTSGYDYPAPARPGEGTVLKAVSTAGRSTTLVDENRQGATILDPPGRSAGGASAPVVGLDATARASLWRFALGEHVDLVDVHDSPRERAAFLRDHLGVSVVQMSRAARPYMGDPEGKDTDGDVALVEHLADNYTGVYGAGDADRSPTTVGNPAVVTSKAVEDVLDGDDRLAGKVSTSAHYGDLDGRNDLGDHHLAALLGSPHYGDHYVERLAALVGEEVERDGRGMNLDYGSTFANDVLRGMREDRVAQAILRFARGDSGAVVFARTAALRDDLPVRGEGRIADTYTPKATRIARAVSTLDTTGERFTAADVAELLDEDAPSRRTIRRVLASFANAGYVERERIGEGTAYGYDQVGEVPAGEVEAPAVDVGGAGDHPDNSRKGVHYTTSVRVAPLDSLLDQPEGGGRPGSATLPAPGTAPERATTGLAPPG